MIKRRFLRWLFLFSFFIVIFILQMMLESINSDSQKSIENQIDRLEDSMRELRQVLRLPLLSSSNQSIQHDQCLWRNLSTVKTDLQSQALYESLPFKYSIIPLIEDGVNIHYDKSQWSSSKKLKVILMPHSHCDPGWLNTFEVYFQHSTRQILDTIVTMLERNSKYKFIWAEMSYLSLWWDQASDHQKNLFKTFLQNRQLEIVTGGWVMNDEANTHYYAMLDQLIEGHQFIALNFGNLTIENSWANDPFGYSPTMTYLLKGAGIKHLAIQRIHHHLKKALGKKKNLEFRWYQTWDRDYSTQIFTHLLPFVSYDIPHSCGPDPKICCQFDFRRGFEGYRSCSWGVDPVLINDENVRERASLLLDQYRKKAQLYRTNVLLVPLGDDFRYQSVREAERQFDNYDRLFSYMNQRTDWHIEVIKRLNDAQYGTLNDYFHEVFQEETIEEFPSYMGDFFTYADRNDEYWSGYFTSRAFYKRMDRVVQSFLRASEISFSAIQIHLDVKKPNDRIFLLDRLEDLSRARQSLGLFQHHDGITGTARAHVVQDYGRKLLQAIHLSQNVLQQSINRLVSPDEFLNLKSNDEFFSFDSLPKRIVISAKDLMPWSHRFYIYNPTDRRRIELIHLLIDIYQIYVTSNDQFIGECQIDPKWNEEEKNRFENDQFELSIRVDIEPYSIKEYTIHRTDSKQRICSRSTIEYFDEEHLPNRNATELFPIRIHREKFIQLKNRHLIITFSHSGAISTIEDRQTEEKLRFHARAISYTTSRLFSPHSGAYLFIPSGDAEELSLSDDHLMRFQRGPMIDRVDLIDRIYSLQYRLTNVNGVSDRMVGLTVNTHLQMNRDTELALRFYTGIHNADEFFTDLNGFQMIRRKTYEKIPLQGNVYPMASMAYLEDQFFRLTILAGQPSGISSLKSGMIDLFIDRRLQRDDGRGLGQGVTDNRPIQSTFQILFESRSSTIDKTSLAGYPTLFAHHRSIEHLYPIQILHSSSTSQSRVSSLPLFRQSLRLPRDYHLVNIRMLKSSSSSIDKRLALILRRFASDCSSTMIIDNDEVKNDRVTFNDFFLEEKIRHIVATTLTLEENKQTLLNSSSIISIPFAEVRTYRIDLF